MIRLDRQSRKYFDYARKRMESNGILFIPVDAPSLTHNGFPCMGLFYEVYGSDHIAELQIAVGSKREEWFPLFVHETSHMEQFLESSPYWHDVYVVHKAEKVEGIDILDRFVHGEEFPQEFLWRAMEGSLAIEWDCERRTLATLDKWALPYDTEVYAQRANAYLYTYPMVLRTRKWPSEGRSAYSLPQVWSRLPKTIRPLYRYHNVPKKTQALYLKHCYDT